MALKGLPRVDDVNCYFCEEPLGEKSEPVLGLFDRLDGFAHPECYDRASEEAQERLNSDFYGGDTPQTDAERYAVAAEEKRRLG